jgi:hypothetical protein
LRERKKIQALSLSAVWVISRWYFDTIESVVKKFPSIIFLFAFVLLLLFQIKTTNIKTAYSFTPYEIDLQIRRMNMYPPSLARLGHIIEVRREIQILEKLQNNFFAVMDFKEYFPNRLPYIFSPFLFIGLYVFVKDRKKWKKFFYAFLFSIVMLTFLGPNAKYGPVLIMPFFVFFVVLGILKIIRRLIK